MDKQMLTTATSTRLSCAALRYRAAMAPMTPAAPVHGTAVPAAAALSGAVTGAPVRSAAVLAFGIDLPRHPRGAPV